jgi:hypothetical protein
MAYDKRALVGVGGWLAFFIITLCLNAFATLVNAFQVSAIPGTARFGADWTAYLALTWGLSAAKAAAFGYMAWRLNARQFAATPRIVIRGLWIVAVLPGFLDALGGMALLGLSAYDAGRSMGTELFRPMIYAAVWTAYLLRSERVANTYADPDGEADQLAAVFE